MAVDDDYGFSKTTEYQANELIETLEKLSSVISGEVAGIIKEFSKIAGSVKIVLDKCLSLVRRKREGEPNYPGYPSFISDMKRNSDHARKVPKKHSSSRDRYRSWQ